MNKMMYCWTPDIEQGGGLEAIHDTRCKIGCMAFLNTSILAFTLDGYGHILEKYSG